MPLGYKVWVGLAILLMVGGIVYGVIESFAHRCSWCAEKIKAQAQTFYYTLRWWHHSEDEAFGREATVGDYCSIKCAGEALEEAGKQKETQSTAKDIRGYVHDQGWNPATGEGSRWSSPRS